MKKSHNRVYISGPMSGVPREVYLERFRTAERMLREEGYHSIVNPVRVWTCRFPWLFRLVGYRLTLIYDLWLLSRCQRFYKMPGWRASRGCQIESCMAYNLQIFLVARPIRDRINKVLEKSAVRQDAEKQDKSDHCESSSQP